MNGLESLPNPFLADLEEDILYHLNPGISDQEKLQQFSDVKLVVVGGTSSRMRLYAKKFSEILKEEVKDFTSSDRYAFLKVGPIITASHGVGTPSASVMLHEVIKLLYHAKCKDVVLIRSGTCGGIGVEPGTVVITRNSVNDHFKPVHEFSRLGKTVSRPTELSPELADSIIACQNNNIPMVKADTLCAADFYESQGRLDGAICEITKDEKMKFLKNAVEAGVRNIEMESSGIASLCNACGIKAAVICVALIDRLKDDQVKVSLDTIREWEERPLLVISDFIRKKFNIDAEPSTLIQ